MARKAGARARANLSGATASARSPSPRACPVARLVAALGVPDRRDAPRSPGLVDRLGSGLDQSARAQLEAAVSRTVEILYVDGTVEQLRIGA